MQTTITIQENGICKIEPKLPDKLNKTINKELSYEKQGAFWIKRRGFWDGKVRLYSLKRQTFNVGLLSRVKKIFKLYSEKYEFMDLQVVDRRRCHNSIEMPTQLNIELRDYQKDAVSAFTHHRIGVIEVATGGGKTEIALECIRRIRKNTIILVHTQELFNQWLARIKDRLHLDAGQIKSGVFKPKSVTVAMIQTLSILIKRGNQECLRVLRAMNLLISDECHHIPCDTVYTIARLTPNTIWRLGLSATPYREDGEDMKIEAVSGRVIYKAGVDQLVTKGYLVPATINYITLEDAGDDDLWLDYVSCYNDYIVNNEMRNFHVIDIAKRESKNGNVLILVDRIYHGNLLKEKLQDSMFISSESTSEEREAIVKRMKNDNNGIIIATQLFKEGVDFPNLRTLILACGGKSSVALMQRIGRLLRIFEGKHRAIIYDFVDTVKWLKEHYKKRLKIVNEIKTFEVKNYDGKIEEQKSLLNN